MKYIKTFNNSTDRKTYMKSKFVSPHIFLNKENLRDIDYLNYIPLEYISSTQTGGQYINLGCKLFENTDDIRIDIKFNMKGGGKDYNETSAVNQTKPSVLIGSISENDPYYGFVVRKADINTKNDNYVTMYAKWAISNSVFGNYNGDASDKKKYYPTYLAGNINGYIQTPTNQIYEKSLIIDNLSSIDAGKFNKMKNLETYMFGIYCDSTNASNSDYHNKMWRFSESDVYYCKIYKGNTLLRDLIPVKRNLDNAVGLYDKQNDHFYISQGDEPFIAGPEI